MKEITVEELLQNPKYICMDVRSPIEYEESHIPGAIHVPLFSNAEREEIGTIYKHKGADLAKWRAMEVVSPKIPSIMQQIRDVLQSGREPVIYCWRGGMRSKSVAMFATMIGLPVARLIGGYKSYRQYILEHMGPQMLPQTVIVFHGLTGIGKTELLRRLTERGWPVLDLEQIANHRGSVFGEFGHWQSHNQKTFDALLFQSLLKLQKKPFVLIEAESKRIGKAVLPDFLIDAKENGYHILLTADLSVRVERTYREYVEPYKDAPWFTEKVENALTVIEKRMSRELRAEIRSALQAENYRKFIELILQNYYDPKYAHKQEEYEKMYKTFDITDLSKGLLEIESFLHEKFAITSAI